MLLYYTAGKSATYKDPAPGCVDQKLSLFTPSSVSGTGILRHEELPIPPSDTPYALEVLLDVFRQQFLNMLESIKKPEYKDFVTQQIEAEKVNVLSICNISIEPFDAFITRCIMQKFLPVYCMFKTFFYVGYLTTFSFELNGEVTSHW